MADYQTSSRNRRVAVLALAGLIVTTSGVGAQGRRWEPLGQISAGTTVQVRTTEPIQADAADGRVYRAIVDNDVLDTDGRLAIEAGSTAELIARPIGGDELEIDLDSVTVEGRRYAVRADSAVVGTAGSDTRIDRRTAESAIGGAVVGGIIGAIAGGKKGAAIGAGVGAAAGAGAQMVTRGRSLNVPADALLTYRLTRPLLLDVNDDGYDRDGLHYHRRR